MNNTNRKRVLLVGQPNVGKSSLLKALTGSHVQISNYPGTTVEVTVARSYIKGVSYEFIDTPGIYNLYASSLEEEVTERVLIEEEYDFVIVVIDATAIERGLVFLLSVIELGVPVIVAVNFWEDAEKKGLKIDYSGLEKDLGVPFVRINPIRKNGISRLVERLDEAKVSSFRITYDDHIERAITIAMECIQGGTKLSRRGLAIRLLEGDPLIVQLYECEHSKKARQDLLEQGHDPYNDIEVTRAGYAMSLTKKHVRITPSSVRALSKLDEILLRNVGLGILTGLSFLAIMIVLTVIFGNEIVDILDSLLGEHVEELVNEVSAKGLLGFAVAKSIEALYAQYTAALPYVFIFYSILVLMEDTGFLTRLVLWLHMLTKKLGLHSKGLIPALLGLGCSVPATTATRILPTIRQRIVVISMLAFIPCSSRASIVFGVAGRTNGALAALGIYALGFVVAAIVARIVSKAIKADEDAVLIEDVPPLRKPKTSIVAEKAWQRLREFIVIVTPLIVAGAVIYAVLAYYKFDNIVIGLFAPFMEVLHLPPSLSIPLVYGFLQKDLVISMMATVLGTSNFAMVLTSKQALVFTMASTYQVPCVIALGMMIRELGLKRSIILWITLDSIGFILTAAYANIPFL